MPGPRLRHLLCLMLLLPMLAGGGGALAGLAADWSGAEAQPAPRAKAQPTRAGGCCGAMANGMTPGAIPDRAAAGCACPENSPCRMQAAPVKPGLAAVMSAPAWPDAPTPTLAPLALDAARPAPQAIAPGATPDPPPQARYLRLAVLRI